MCDAHNNRPRQDGEPAEKRCNKCKVVKPIEDFGWWRGQVGKRKSECDPCSAKHGQTHRRHYPAGRERPLCMRKCHDCGCDTTDYRCEICQEKHLRKHGIPLGARHEHGSGCGMRLALPRNGRCWT